MPARSIPRSALSWSPAFAALLVPVGAAATDAASYGALPPAPQAAFASSEEALMLELFVNGLRTGIVAPVLRMDRRYRMEVADLKRAGLLIEHGAETLFLDELPGITADYDMPLQRLRITAAPDYLPAQRLGRSKQKFKPAQYDVGALLNYDVYVGGGEGKSAEASLYHEARLFGPAGIASTTGALRSGPGKAYVRLDTVWRRSDEATSTTIEVGDFVTRTLPWAPAVRLGGIQVSRDFSVRPDIITYPLPEFSGTAALPSTIDLIIDDQRVAGGRVNPGPFALDGVLPISGAGKANLVVTDMHGRSIAESMPFYVSSNLLRPGLTDFAVAFGAFRDGYGVTSLDYGRVAGSASGRHGVTPGITLEVRAEIADDMQLAGGGAVVKLGAGGVVSGAYSRSFGNAGRGGQLTLGYEYQARSFSLALRHSRRDAAYVDLGSLELARLWRAERISSATMSASLGRAGTLGAGFFDTRSGGRKGTRLANASWTLPLWAGSRLGTSATYEFKKKIWSSALSISVPLGGRRGNLSAGFIDSPGTPPLWRADYAHSAPVDGGLGWSASAVHSKDGGLYLRGDIDLRTKPMLLRGGAYGSDRVTAWAGASGSLIVMDRSIFAANRVADAFVVVNAGEPDIPVRYENQLVGRTNANGQLLIPWANAFYPAQYEIDPLSLPANVKVPVVSQRVSVARGSGYVVQFPVERMTAARAIVVDGSGTPLPAGAAVHGGDGEMTYIGWDGLLFLENVKKTNRFTVELPDGTGCHLVFGAEPEPTGIADLGELICAPILS